MGSAVAKPINGQANGFGFTQPIVRMTGSPGSVRHAIGSRLDAASGSSPPEAANFLSFVIARHRRSKNGIASLAYAPAIDADIQLARVSGAITNRDSPR